MGAHQDQGAQRGQRRGKGSGGAVCGPPAERGLCLRKRYGMAAGVRGDVSFRGDGGSAECHRGYQGGHGESPDHGPSDLRRCGIWQDRDRHPCRLQGSAGGQTGGIPGAHHHFSAAALQHFCAENEGFPGQYCSDEPIPHAFGDQKDGKGSGKGNGRYCHRHSQSIVGGCEVQGSGAFDHR